MQKSYKIFCVRTVKLKLRLKTNACQVGLTISLMIIAGYKGTAGYHRLQPQGTAVPIAVHAVHQVCITIEHKLSFTVFNWIKILLSRQEYLIQMIISTIDLKYLNICSNELIFFCKYLIKRTNNFIKY